MAPPTTSVLDTFNRPNETPASGWGALAGGTVGLKVVSNQAANNSGGGYSYWQGGRFGPDGVVFATVPVPAGGGLGGEGPVLIIRAQPGSGSWNGYMLDVTDQGFGEDLWTIQLVQGNFSSLATATSASLPAGSLIALEAVGATLRAWKRVGAAWTLVVTAIDDTFRGEGYLGAHIIDVISGIRLDDFGGATYHPAGVETSHGPLARVHVSDSALARVDVSHFPLGTVETSDELKG